MNLLLRNLTSLLSRVSLLAALLAACVPLSLAAGSASAPTVAEQYLLSAANQERAARGLPPLKRDPQLAQAALLHAREMAAHRTISHQFNGEPELASRASSAGVHFSVVEENVGEAPSPVTIHNLWMHSPHHRENLLNPSVDEAGISVVALNGELYAVEDFAKSVRPASFGSQEAAIGSLVARRGVNILSTPEAISAARETCRMQTGYAGSKRPWFVMRFTSDSLDTLPSELASKIATGKYRHAAVGACPAPNSGNFTAYNIAVLLYP